MPSSRGSSQPRDWTWSPALQAGSLPAEPPGKPKNTTKYSFKKTLDITHKRWREEHRRVRDLTPQRMHSNKFPCFLFTLAITDWVMLKLAIQKHQVTDKKEQKSFFSRKWAARQKTLIRQKLLYFKHHRKKLAPIHPCQQRQSRV